MSGLSRPLLLVLLVALIAAFFLFDLGQYLTLDYFKARLADFNQFYQERPILTLGSYFAVYVLVTTLSLPGAAIMTLLGGALFGFATGSILVSLASTLGATLAFLLARWLFRDAVQARFSKPLDSINRGVKKEGAFYLFTMRLFPGFPFFVVNLAMALTPIRAITYTLVSWIGMLPGTLAYVNAGTQLANIDSLSGILSAPVLASFAALGLLPLVAKKLIDWLRTRRVYQGYDKPKTFDRNLVVIGGGSAGLVTAYIAAAVKAQVTLIERHKMGGDCLNTGCVPSKALLRSAKFRHDVERSSQLGFHSASTEFAFSDVMDRVHQIIKKIEPHDSMERYRSLGVDCIEGEAEILDPFRVRVDDRILTTKNIVIATGARPFVPPIPGLDEVNYLSSDNLWDLQELPPRLVVLGGGPIGCEMAQAFARLGSDVTLVEMLDRVMSVEDEDAATYVADALEKDGVKLLTSHRAEQALSDSRELVCSYQDQTVRIPFDEILVAVGRRANTDSIGADKLELEKNPNGTLVVDEFLRTRFPNIFACGDVISPYQFTHTASHEAWFCAVNALFGSFKRFRVDYSVIPWATYTDPEVARVGLSEDDAAKQGIAVEVTRYQLDGLDRALAEQEARGFVKVLTPPRKDTILGATIVGPHAGDLLAEFVLAMKHGLGLNKILSTIHAYPTLAEATKFTAGQWKQANKPEKLLSWVQRFHRWRLG